MDMDEIIKRLRSEAAEELRPHTGTLSNFRLREDALILSGYTAALDAIEREMKAVD
jgi:hypothetical protein